MDCTEALRRLAINDEHIIGELASAADTEAVEPDRVLEARTLCLVRLAALVAVGGAVPSYGAQADAAIGAGATRTEIVDLLVGIVPVVWIPACRRSDAEARAGARIRHRRTPES